ncbi:NAD(P)-binding protein [Sarocladium strictum]
MARIWFVTGASRGLGLAITHAALDSGDLVVATARTPSQLSHLIENYGTERVLTLELDVTNNDQVIEAINKTVEKFGRLDVLVNNAGYANINSIEDMTLQDFKQQFDTNFFGTMYASKAVIPVMRKQGSGRIIQISSLGGRLGSPGLSAYQSAKWAVGGFSTVLQGEVAPFGIKVTVCEPGGMKTDWLGSSMEIAPVSEGYESTIGAGVEFRKQLTSSWSEPSQVAKSILYISTVEDPPMKLLLGPETPGYAKMIAEGLAKEDEKWKEVTMLQV